MERLTDKKEADAQRKEYENRLKNGYPRNIPEERFLKLAAYEDTGLGPEDIEALRDREQGLAELLVNVSCGCAVSYTRLAELAQAEKDGRLVVLEPTAKEGKKKPPCFYNDMGQTFCLGFARGQYDDEPIDRCKECWYCESTREEAEEALKERGEDNEAD